MRIGPRGRAATAGLAAGIAVLVSWSVWPQAVEDGLSTPAIDALYTAFPGPVTPGVVVVDIDRASFGRLGAWPWPRDRLAALVERIAGAAPRALAIDILLSEPDRRSPAALARALGAATGRDDLARLAEGLPDPDARLAAAIARVPTVLGLVAAAEPGGATAGPPIVIARQAAVGSVWTEPGVEGPLAVLAAGAAGIGVLSLTGDEADGVVRGVPLLAVFGGRAYAGLAAEAARVAEGARSHLVAGSPAQMAIGSRRVPVSARGTMALRPTDRTGQAATTVSAADLFDPDPAPARARLAGAIVFLGSSAPELGGLRPTPADPLTPSVRIQADAAGQILSGRIPVRAAAAVAWERAAALLAAVLAVILALVTGPWFGAAAMIAAAAAWAAGAATATLQFDQIVDPVTPPAVALIAFAATSLAAFAETRRREGALRRRFEQHLAPDLVRRIVENPDLVRVEGELRPVTALFTDVEGFTSLTERAEPRALVALLDRYFEGMTQTVVAHGGLVDKIVGDAVHALFNVPVDQPDHAARAVDCAEALAAFAARFAREPDAAALGFGRTRIGLETGPAIVGDVGGGRKLDFTAHGTVVNSAARLEAANKTFGSTICVGPALVAALPERSWRPLGRITLRGLSVPTLVSEPWPDGTSAGLIAGYAAAFARVEDDPAGAAAAFAALAADHPGDAVLAGWAARLGGGGSTG